MCGLTATVLPECCQHRDGGHHYWWLRHHYHSGRDGEWHQCLRTLTSTSWQLGLRRSPARRREQRTIYAATGKHGAVDRPGASWRSGAGSLSGNAREHPIASETNVGINPSNVLGTWSTSNDAFAFVGNSTLGEQIALTSMTCWTGPFTEAPCTEISPWATRV